MAAIRRLKSNKSAGPDGLLAEHLKFAGWENIIIWLRNVMNGIVELEMIPDFMKKGSVVPVYKGGSKDPMRMDNYRGITIAPVLSKVLEFLILGRLQDAIQMPGMPHINQTAYKKKTSCADAIFASLEMISVYLESGSDVFMCL